MKNRKINQSFGVCIRYANTKTKKLNKKFPDTIYFNGDVFWFNGDYIFVSVRSLGTFMPVGAVIHRTKEKLK